MSNHEKLALVGKQLRKLLAKEAASRGVEKVVMSFSDLGGFEVTVETLKPSGREKAVDVAGLLVADVTRDRSQKTKVNKKQTKNNAGGYVFKVSDETRVRRFLIMGTTGGAFYLSAKELTVENLVDLMKIIDQGNASMILQEIKEISLAGRNPKQEPVMSALAVCARYRTGQVKGEGYDSEPAKLYVEYLKAMHATALELITQVCRIPTHLFIFVDYCEKVAKHSANPKGSTGWGRAFRAAIRDWYATKSPRQIAMAITKYKQRGGWSHRDLFRLAHPALKYSADDDHYLEREQLFHYIAKGELKQRKRTYAQAELDQLAQKPTEKQMEKEQESWALELVETYKSFANCTDEYDVVAAIHKLGMVREHIPPELLNSVPIWKALLNGMPMNALIRNLAKMTAINVIDSDNVKSVCEQLTNAEAIYGSRIHPMQILVAHEQYNRGQGDKGKLAWAPNQKIVTALEKAFHISFKNVVPTGKRYCFAFDVSGSMTQEVLGTTISARTASVAMGMIGMKTEEHVEPVAFCDSLVEIPWEANDSDLEPPTAPADGLGEKVQEATYYGKIHPHEALLEYRKASGIHDAKLAVLGMCSNSFSIADPDEAGMMDFQGFDPCFPQMLSDFAMGRF
ncbi:unnamed protein product, partial [Mesorhabditis spiculigera]